MRTIKESRLGVISNPGIPGEKSLNLKQISPRILVEMTVTNDGKNIFYLNMKNI